MMMRLLQCKHLLLVFLWVSLVACPGKGEDKHEAPLTSEDSPDKQPETPKKPVDDTQKPENTDTLHPPAEGKPTDGNTSKPKLPPTPPPTPPVQPPEDDKPPITTPGNKPNETTNDTPPPLTDTTPEITRGTPPPRAKFAKEDLEVLMGLFHHSYAIGGSNLPEGFKKIAEIFQFDRFRSVPVESSNLESSEVPRVLLLGYDETHLKEAINFFSALAKNISEKNSAFDTRRLVFQEQLPVASLEIIPMPDPDANPFSLFYKILVNIDAAYSKFIKQVPLSKKMKKFWPEAVQLEMSFGTDRVLFVFPSIIQFSVPHSTAFLEGKVLLQTPWILRALEGETISALWQAVSMSQIDNSEQFASTEWLYKHNVNCLFESMWDERSAFFPKQNAFRIVDSFDGPGKSFQGSVYLGYQDLKFEFVSDFRSLVRDLKVLTPFTFRNKIQSK